jgi:hypothetical protein
VLGEALAEMAGDVSGESSDWQKGLEIVSDFSYERFV